MLFNSVFVNLFGYYIQVYNQQIEQMFKQLLQVYLSCHIHQMPLIQMVLYLL